MTNNNLALTSHASTTRIALFCTPVFYTLIALIGTLSSVGAHAQETILDNGGAAYATTGTWTSSTAVTGYHGANYDTRFPGPSPDALVVDNDSAAFNTTGTWTASTAVSGYLGSNYQHHFANGAPPAATIVDNAQGTATGTWSTSTSVNGYYASNYRAAAAGTGTQQFNWALPVTSSGNYDVYARWTAHANRASNAAYTVNHSGGSTVVTVSQQTNGAQWVLLGNFALDPAQSPSINLTDQANGYVIADAVMAVPEGAQPNTATWALDVAAPGAHDVYARWTAHPNRATNAAYTIHHSGGTTVVTVDQQSNMAQWQLLGNFVLDSAQSPSVSLSDQANGYVIADAIMAVSANAAPNSAVWTPAAGTYEVYARWSAHPNRATNAPYTVNHAGGSTVLTFNQQLDGGQWNLLGSFTFNSGAHNITLSDEADGYVVADAIRLVAIAGNTPPTVSLTSPVDGTTYSEPASIDLAATASDTDGTVTQVEFFEGSNLIATDTTAPYTFTWTNVAAGSYSITAKATDNDALVSTSVAVNVTVNAAPAVAQTYYIHADHLNSPRVITDANQVVVWRWDNSDPFGANVASEDPDGNGISVTCNLRFPGQYFDRETGNHYNYFRDYNPSTGRYIESDPIGLDGGLNTFGYVGGDPLSRVDPTGEYWKLVWEACKRVWKWIGPKSSKVKPKPNPARTKRCQDAFLACLNNSSIPEELCFTAHTTCVSTTGPMIFPGYGVVR